MCYTFVFWFCIGLQQEWQQVAEQYKSKLSGRDYFKDLVQIHDILGLATKHGATTAFSSLVS